MIYIDENTRSKFLFYGGPDCLNINDGLEYYIDSGIIPDFLGGPCPVGSHYSFHDDFLFHKALKSNRFLKILCENFTNNMKLEWNKSKEKYLFLKE